MSPANSTQAQPGAQLHALLQLWASSLALHRQYASLEDERYWHVQPWPKHERPAPWILQLATERVAELQAMVTTREASGDREFLAALELMSFLANLVGLTTVDRFIPLATAGGERRDILTEAAANAITATNTRLKRAEESTRQMPRLPASKVTRMLMQQRAGVPLKALQSTAKSNSKRTTLATPTAKATAKAPAQSLTRQELLVLEDAVRLLGWGRKWHELGELIPRLAERPSPSETRRILRTHRAVVEKRLGASVD
jgi:hypothetical protein